MSKPCIIDPRILDELHAKRDALLGLALPELPTEQVSNMDGCDFLALFPDSSVDMIFSDEGYGVEASVIAFRGERSPIVTDFSWDEALPFHLTMPWVYQAARVLKEGGALINCGIQSWATTFEQICIDAGLDFRAHITWIKTNPPFRVRHGGFRSGHEMVWVASKGTMRKRMKKVPQQELLNWLFETACPKCKTEFPITYSNTYALDDLDYTDSVMWGPPIIVGPYVHHSKRSHETQKPEWIVAKYVDMMSEEGQVLVDPFTGSGTIPYVAATMRRKVYANDLDPKWADFTRKRLSAIQQLLY